MPRERKSARFAAVCLLVLGCSSAAVIGGRVAAGSLRNGVFDGSYGNFPNSAEVRVTIRDGRIADIKILKHNSSWIGARAEQVTVRIIRDQSTSVDVVSGATNSSRVIMNAVQKALDQASKK